jgi:glutathione synthase/RimK-type ligase-like ATP-grasp enzyme
MKRVAFVTFEAGPDLTDDDGLALAPLEALGVSVEPLVWTAPLPEPEAFDALVLRSCWDYHRKPDDFVAWLGRFEGPGPALWNPPALCRWNLNKRYLLDLAAAGVRVPHTRWLPRGSRVSPDEAALPGDPPGVVVKPAVSLNGEDTFLFSTERRAEIADAANAILRERDLLLQAFVPEIFSQGETSLVFFDGAYSHAVRKLPTGGEFRVQAEYGGRREPARPPPEIVERARAALAVAGGPTPLYARVDGVVTEAGFTLIELEVLDPTLFLGFDEGAPGRFAAALGRRLALPRGGPGPT